MTAPLVHPDAKSPYKRYAKKPYRYSELYVRWKEARKEGRTQEADRLGRQHSIANLGQQYTENMERMKRHKRGQ